VVEHIEKHWCPSITSDQLIGGKPFHFAADKRPSGPDGSPRRIPSKTEVEPDYAHPSPEAMERWYDLKYGFRIHWGLYAIKPVGPESWPLNKAGDASWTLTKNGMEFMEWYHQQYKTWNPAGFNADDWIAFMRRGGMKFFVFTTKHHEGFCMFDTRTRVRKRFIYSGPNAGSTEDCDLAYGIIDTPFKRDVVKELVDAARKGGVVPGLYFSHPDWYDADFRIDQWNPMKRFMKNIQYTRENDPEAWDRMVKRHREQIREILTNYGPISEASLDMSMPDSFWPDMVETIKMARRLQPDCLFRNRGIGPYGDYHTPEGWIPDSPKSRESSTPWQVIYPLARWFSYDPEDKAYKPGSWIVYNVVDITAKGGLFMVGFGPDGDGKFHPKAVEAVEYAGDWLKVNGEAIYGTRPWTYWKEGDDVRFTRTKDNRFVYAISLKWPGDTLALRSLRAKEGSAVTLLGFKEPLKWRNDGERGLVIEVPKELQDEAKRPCKQAYAFRIEDWRDDRGVAK
jgi:alpha-L-fucosidase